ncbi:hypothetical protein AAMO2058_001269400 [Amorphochlora amoebiformis]
MDNGPRHGTSHPSEDPSLAVHWAATFLLIALLGFAATWTQSALVKLYNEGIRVQQLEHPHIITALLLIKVFYAILPVVKYGANIYTPCALYVIWSQLMVSVWVSLNMVRFLYFTRRTAQIQRCKQYMGKGVRQNKFFASGESERKEKATQRILRNLKGSRIRYLATACFFGCLVFIFLDPTNIDSIQMKRNKCSIRTSLAMIFVWFVWISLYVFYCGRGFFDSKEDPYRTLYKLKIQSSSLLISTVFAIPITLFGESVLGTSHWGLLFFNLVAITIMMLKTTQDSPIENGNYGLLHILATPALLELFEDHLLQEWSPENIEFYKTVVLFELQLEEILKRLKEMRKHYESDSISPMDITIRMNKAIEKIESSACEIYTSFISEEATYQVNIPSRIKLKIDVFFQHKRFSRYIIREDSENTPVKLYNPLKDGSRSATPQANAGPRLGFGVDGSLPDIVRPFPSPRNRVNTYGSRTDFSHSPQKYAANTLGSITDFSLSPHKHDLSLSLGQLTSHRLSRNTDVKGSDSIIPSPSNSRRKDTKRDSVRAAGGSPTNIGPFSTQKRRKEINKFCQAVAAAALAEKSPGQTPNVSGLLRLEEGEASSPRGSKQRNLQVPRASSSNLERKLEIKTDMHSIFQLLRIGSASYPNEETKVPSMRTSGVLMAGVQRQKKNIRRDLLVAMKFIMQCGKVFEDAKIRVFNLMEGDSFRRFLLKPKVRQILLSS